jgi:hypothetical protein
VDQRVAATPLPGSFVPWRNCNFYYLNYGQGKNDRRKAPLAGSICGLFGLAGSGSNSQLPADVLPHYYCDINLSAQLPIAAAVRHGRWQMIGTIAGHREQRSARPQRDDRRRCPECQN